MSRISLEDPISKYMVPKDKIVFGRKGISLTEANDIIWDNKISCLPILDENDNLDTLVFRKDYESDKENPNFFCDKFVIWFEKPEQLTAFRQTSDSHFECIDRGGCFRE